MNDNPETAAEPEAGGATSRPKPEDGPSPSTRREPPAERPVACFERLTGLFRQRNGSSLREEIADALAETDADGEVLLARRAGDAQQHPAAARGARRGRHGPARRHRGGRDRHHARRPAGPVRAVRPFAHAGLFRDARRSARHGPHPRRAGPHHPRLARVKKGRGASASRRRRPRSTSPMSTSPRRSASST